MATIKCKQATMNTLGQLPELHKPAPDFFVSNMDLDDISLEDELAGQAVLINVYPSIDTKVCFSSVRKFTEETQGKKIQTVCISMDTPFALQRASKALNISNMLLLSDIRNRLFGANYGVTIADGPLAGFLARAVFLLDESHNVLYRELVKDISNPPNYQAVLDLM